MTDHFQTTDMNLAVAMAAIGHSLIYLEKIKHKQVSFIFDMSPSLLTDVQNFWAGNLSIEPNHLLACQKQIKTRLHNELRG